MDTKLNDKGVCLRNKHGRKMIGIVGLITMIKTMIAS